MAMLKSLRDKWVAALRSGEYQQGRGLLRQHNLYCCLGVLCDVSGIGSWNTRPYPATNGEQEFRFERGVCHLYFPDLLLEKLGIEDKMQDRLSKMNDSEQRSFNYIADYIEEYVSVME